MKSLNTLKSKILSQTSELGAIWSLALNIQNHAIIILKIIKHKKSLQKYILSDFLLNPMQTIPKIRSVLR